MTQMPPLAFRVLQSASSNFPMNQAASRTRGMVRCMASQGIFSPAQL